MKLEDLKKPLKIEDIDFRIQSINKGGYATVLAYKDARVDINRLNEVCGVLGWKREHTRDNKNCIVSIYDNKYQHWVSKEDTGTESNTEAQKGLASDSFKRACFNFGIGIELYDYPVISVKLFSNEWKLEKDNRGIDKAKATFYLKLKEWKWSSVFENGVLVRLEAKDQNNKERFVYDIINHENKKVIELEDSNYKKLSDCKTLNDLKDVYTSLSKSEQEKYLKLKDELKTKLK